MHSRFHDDLDARVPFSPEASRTSRRRVECDSMRDDEGGITPHMLRPATPAVSLRVEFLSDEFVVFVGIRTTGTRASPFRRLALATFFADTELESVSPSAWITLLRFFNWIAILILLLRAARILPAIRAGVLTRAALISLRLVLAALALLALLLIGVPSLIRILVLSHTNSLLVQRSVAHQQVQTGCLASIHAVNLGKRNEVCNSHSRAIGQWKKDSRQREPRDSLTLTVAGRPGAAATPPALLSCHGARMRRARGRRSCRSRSS